MYKEIKTNSVGISYEMLSEEGKTLKKRQSFNLMSYVATDEDFFDVGNALEDILAYGINEISKNNVTILMED